MSAHFPPLKFGIPPIGIGTYELRGDACVTAVRAALQLGYRLIDTAAVYRNEELVGEGITSSGVPRHELFVVVKIAMKSMGSDETVRGGILDSIRKLRIRYADCVMIHWPGCGGLRPDDAAGHHAARARCWRIMKALQQEGKVRYLGVSNFLPRHFAELQCFDDNSIEKHHDMVVEMGSSPSSSGQQADALPTPTPSTSYTLPAVNQVELHPLCVQRDVDMYCRAQHGMVLQQYSPLGKGDMRLLRHPRLLEVHARYFASAAMSSSETNKQKKTEPEVLDEETADASRVYSVPDLVLMWGLAQGYCALVRSHQTEHLQSNLAAAKDYFASLPGACVDDSDASRTRPLLTTTQLEVVRNLRLHMGVEDAEDLHLCWYSSEIA